MLKNADKMIVVGQLGSPHGVHGWIKLFSYTEPAINILHYPHWFIEDKTVGWQPIEPVATQAEPQGKRIRVKFPDCDTPEQARLYTHLRIAIMRDQLPPLAADDYYWSDLEGLTVVNRQDVVLGKIDHLFSTGANDVIVVKGDRERLLPYIKEVVLAVDLAQQRMIVDWDADF